MQHSTSLVPLAPLAGAIVVGLFGPRLGRAASHWLCILGVADRDGRVVLHLGRRARRPQLQRRHLHVAAVRATSRSSIGFLIDPLTATMMLVVTFVSLMVHVYTIGYMADDPGYTRFFSYISLFTFSMLMLVMSNNFVQLFFGWEAVGLVSYLLIGFWYTRPTAIYANLKAFLANRVGDFGFVLGIGLVLAHFGTLDYAPVFGGAQRSPGRRSTCGARSARRMEPQLDRRLLSSTSACRSRGRCALRREHHAVRSRRLQGVGHARCRRADTVCGGARARVSAARRYYRGRRPRGPSHHARHSFDAVGPHTEGGCRQGSTARAGRDSAA